MGGPYPVFDGHIDILSKLATGDDDDFFDPATTTTHFDLPRADEGGVTGGLFALFAENPPAADDARSAHLRDGDDVVEIAPAITESYAREQTFAQLARLHRLKARSNGDLEVVTTADELRRSVDDDGCFTTLVHLEGAASLGHDLSYLPLFYEAGLRSVGLVWSRANAFGHGVPFRRPSSPDIGPGLTDAGHELVRQCNRLGIVIDLAHINEAGFWDVAAHSTDPLVVSHSAVHELSPSARNLTDEQIDAVGESGGVVGLTLHVADVHPNCERDAGVAVDVFVDHIDYVADRIGVEHVALGSDFDGADMPDVVADASRVQALFEGLAERGYTREEIRRVARDNWVSVLAETLSGE